MATCLAERFAGPAAPAAAPSGELRAGGMFFRALWTRIKALFGRRG
jgi:hypothetical protein